MGFSFRDVVSVVQVILYVPSLALAVYCILRHGNAKTSGWVYLVIFCFVRTLGAILEIVIHHQSNPSSNLIETYGILDSIGLSPLFLSTLGLLSRV
jgi:hypothetical protein